MKRLFILLFTVGLSAFAQVQSAPDFDRDGIPDTQDPCPYTASGAPAISKGCSALDVAENPGHLINPILADLEQTAAAAKRYPDLYAVEILPAVHELRAAAERTAAADICGSTSGYARGVSRLAEAIIVMQKVRLAYRLKKGSDPETLTAYAVLHDEINHAHQRAVSAKQIFDRLCSGVRGNRYEGTITKIDDASRRMEIDNRIVVGMAATFRTSGPVYVGRRVVVNGPLVTDAAIIANDLGFSTDEPVDMHPGIYEDCVQIRLAPVQRMEPGYPGPFTKHRLEGYLWPAYTIGWSSAPAGYHTEEGMAIAAEARPCQGPERGRYKRYSLDVKLNGVTVAVDLDENDPPVKLPRIQGILTVTSRLREGSIFSASPDKQQVLKVRDYQMLFHEEPLCEIDYLYKGFMLGPESPAVFQTTSVDDVRTFDVPWPNFQFHAEGYLTTGSGPGAQSSFPTPLAVSFNTPFSIHRTDFYDPNSLYSREIHGVDRASGLRFPRIAGERNGHPFQHRCKVPRIARDMLAPCPTREPTYLRLPLHGTSPDLYAVDEHPNYWEFGVPLENGVYAARKGVVTAVVTEDNGLRTIVIKHEDDSAAVYKQLSGQLPPNAPVVGTHVMRGDLIAHLTSSRLMFKPFWPESHSFGGHTFQMYAPGTTNIVNCVLPEPGVALSSNNY